MEQVKAEPVEELRDMIANAYAAGATDTHNWWAAGNVEGEADFGEAASDYAASVIVRLPNPQPAAVDGLVAALDGLDVATFQERKEIGYFLPLTLHADLRQALAQIERKPEDGK